MKLFKKARQSKENKKVEEVTQAYLEEVRAVGVKHGRTLIAALGYSDNGVVPELRVAILEQPKA